ncbi:MAG: glycerophosphoryl diester phosphodiesterase membrane domain-containing protein, partial [Thermotogota bacterium]
MKKGYFSTIFKNTIIDTYYGLWYYFLYILVIYHFLTLLVIMPFFEHFIIRQLLSMEHFLAVGAGYGIRFLLYMVILYLEFALYILISEKIYNKKKITLVTIAKSLFERVRFALSFSNWRIMIVFLMIFPFLNLPLTSTLIKNLDISVTIREYIKSHHMLYILSIVVLIILVYFSIKWSYALPYSVLKKKSVKESVSKTQKYLKSIFIFHLFFLLLLFSAGALILQSEKWFLNDFLLLKIFDEDVIMIMTKFFLICLAVVVAVFVIPFYFNFLTHLYHSRKGDPSHAVDFKGMSKKRYSVVLTRNIFLILFSLGMNFIGFFIFQDINFEKSKVMVHRAGGEIVTENTAEAIEYAVSNQFNAIEIDIMETKDGYFVLSHDLNIKRLTGQDKRVNKLTLKELKDISIKGQRKMNFITLEEALGIAKGEVLVNIELKTHGRESSDYLDRLCDIITDFDMMDE